MVKAAALGVENLFPGRVRAHDPAGGVTSVELPAGQTIAVPLAADCAPGIQVTVAVRAEDVIVSKGVPAGISARNIYEVRITALSRTGPDVTLRCDSTAAAGAAPLEWIVRVTPAAVTSLGLQTGQSVFLAVKSHSVRLL
jgi:ABC-type molybdate transport system ATPase subunit